jgi:hypothetical protein
MGWSGVDMGGDAGEHGEVLVEEECDERLEVYVVDPEGRVGGPHQGHHPTGRRGGERGPRCCSPSFVWGSPSLSRIRTEVRTSTAEEGS